jgi:hypothetical protein
MSRTPERWIYGGVHVSGKGKRVHAWIDPGGHEHVYADTGSYVIGGIYDVEVDRENANLTRTAPKYTGERIADDDRRRELYAADQFARAQLARLAMERGDAKRDELAGLLDPLREFAATLRTSAERDAFAAMVLRTINTAWR